MKQIIIVKDIRTDKIYIDLSGSMIRSFEKIIDSFDKIEQAKKKFPEAIIICENCIMKKYKKLLEK